MAGDLAAAERQLRWGYEQLEQIGETEVRSTMAAMLAQVLHEQGRDDEAEQFALTSDELAAADDVYSQLLWRSALAKVRARRDGAEDARELAAAGRDARRGDRQPQLPRLGPARPGAAWRRS